jgi:hypothetical protein
MESNGIEWNDAVEREPTVSEIFNILESVTEKSFAEYVATISDNDYIFYKTCAFIYEHESDIPALVEISVWHSNVLGIVKEYTILVKQDWQDYCELVEYGVSVMVSNPNEYGFLDTLFCSDKPLGTGYLKYHWCKDIEQESFAIRGVVALLSGYQLFSVDRVECNISSQQINVWNEYSKD